jgi:alpha-1,3-fucosyltransferase
MSYRLDSDILWLYGRIIDRETQHTVDPSTNVNWKNVDENFVDEKVLKLLTNKTKTAAWLVSHCKAPSKRDNLTQKLQHFIDVDIMGECGTLSCPENFECLNYVEQNYWFYLAFENSLCIDYITEKSYKIMELNVIPVIFSGAQLSRFLPPKSYIDANDFTTTEDLANHLKFLTQNLTEYVKHFWWKKNYKITERIGIYNPCEICKKLSEPNLQSKHQVYENFGEWYEKNICMDAKIQF